MLPTGILTCCTGPFWSGSLCLFGFCLPSLRYLISALTQAGWGDLLFRFASSVQSCCGEGGALQTNIAVCGEHSLCSGHTGVCPAQGCLHFPRLHCSGSGCSIWSGPCLESALSTLRLGSSLRVLHKSADSVAPAFCAFLGLSCSGSQELDWRTIPGCGAPFPLHGPSLNFCARPVRCQRLVFVLRSWPLAETLWAAGVDHPESQEVFG